MYCQPVLFSTTCTYCNKTNKNSGRMHSSYFQMYNKILKNNKNYFVQVECNFQMVTKYFIVYICVL